MLAPPSSCHCHQTLSKGIAKQIVMAPKTQLCLGALSSSPFWNRPPHPQAFRSGNATKMKSIHNGGRRSYCVSKYLPPDEWVYCLCSTVCVWEAPDLITTLPSWKQTSPPKLPGLLGSFWFFNQYPLTNTQDLNDKPLSIRWKCSLLIQTNTGYIRLGSHIIFSNKPTSWLYWEITDLFHFWKQNKTKQNFKSLRYLEPPLFKHSCYI